MRIRLPVRSAIYKHCTGGLVVRWVTTSESPLLYVFAFFFAIFLVVETEGGRCGAVLRLNLRIEGEAAILALHVWGSGAFLCRE